VSALREFTVVDVPGGHVTRLHVSEQLIRTLAAEYGGQGWRICRMGDVLVLHSRETEDVSRSHKPAPAGSIPSPASTLEHAAAQLLHVWQGGLPLDEKHYRDLSRALYLHRLERDAREAGK